MLNFKKSLLFLISFQKFMQSSIKPQLPVKLLFKPKEQGEGDGARVRRIIGISQLKNFDPFLMLDQFCVKLPAGFPDHPHRGFATMTYLMGGRICHEDFKGHKGELGPGDIQVMTAGKGIVHAEMPMSFEEEAVGFQLWLNLKMSDKYGPADYQEYKAESIPSYEVSGIKAKVVVGEYMGTKSIIKTKTPSEFIDFVVDAGMNLEKTVNKGWNSFLVMYDGKAILGEKTVVEKNTAVFFENLNEESRIIIKSESGCKFIFVSGEPIGEPIFQYGPFVLTSEKELSQAFEDYEEGKNGFENSRTWKSKIKDLKYKKNEK